MKRNTAVVGVSLALNLAFAAAWFWHGGPQVAAKTSTDASTAVNHQALVTHEFRRLASADESELIAMGCPSDVARDLLAGRAYSRMQARMVALGKTVTADRNYWRDLGGALTPSQQAEVEDTRRDFAHSLELLFGKDALLDPNGDPRQAYIPATTRAELDRIRADYAIVRSNLLQDMRPPYSAADRAKITLLVDEERRDILAALTPTQRREYDLQESQTALNVRANCRGVLNSEAEYRKVFDLQKAFDDRFGTDWMLTNSAWMTAEENKTRMDAARLLREDLRAALGDETFDRLRRSSDWDFRSLLEIAQRAGTSKAAVETFFDSKDRYARASGAIAADANLSTDERKRRIREIGTAAEAELTRVFGTDTASRYSERNEWLNDLKHGTPVSTDLRMLPGGLVIR